jgi:hypothetical protein
MAFCRFLCVVSVGLMSFGSPRSGYACGGGLVSPLSAQVGASTQRIFLSVRNARTDVVTQIVVPETTADYGVILPVPGEPILDPEPVSASDLAVLDEATAPHITVSNSDGGSGCGCPLGAGSDAQRAGGANGVHVSDGVDIGPVTVVVLGGDDAAGIQVWLTDNGFVLPPPEGPSLIEQYAGNGRYFIAIRRSDTSVSGGPSSIGVHFTLSGDQRGLPLRFARLGAAETVAFTVFVAAERAAAPAPPFEALTLLDLDAGTLRGADYASAVQEAVSAHDGLAFVIEGTHPATALLGGLHGTRLEGFLDSGQTVTRLSTVLLAAALTADVTLDREFSGETPDARHVRVAPPAGANGVAYGAAIALAGAVIGRRRPPPAAR